ncbi:DUF3562 domain-containing protein [Thiobacillus denitrificans]|uniref:DUF3562 domain-containing protein n=1 Tax=Thiobacillus denitrificans TaxID=36861 RepID=UPI00059CDDAE|nr:DUF3562 domain-containing protein [Thiobacillus denitrificans]
MDGLAFPGRSVCPSAEWRPEEEVRKFYAEAFERMSTGARVKDFLIVLTSREVRELLEGKVNRR